VRQHHARGGADREELPEPPKLVGDEKNIQFTNLDKPYWPEDGYTKGDLIEYYRTISPWLLPYLADRPLVLTRYPDGIDGKSFYQKDAPEWTPDWIETVRIEHDSKEKPNNYFVANELESLLYVANLGAIPLHLWHSRVADLEHPDWCLMDLDPKEAPFAHVVECALFLHDLCDEIGLPHYVKTTGSSGIHILIPLARQMDYEQSRTLGELLARVTVKALPKISTITRAVKSRGGKVYVDFMQNAQGQLMASPFCVRPKKGAPVSAPLTWDEVGPKLDLMDYTIETMPARMEKLKKKGVGDPCAPVLTEKPNLLTALEKLTAKMK
jgi:bifunctional non-homologous end joining protein LigD